MEMNNNCTNNTNANNEINESELIKAIKFIVELKKKAKQENTTPNFAIPEASETTKSRINNITTELGDELEIQRLEVVNKSAGIDLEVLQHAIQRMQDDIKQKQEEELKKIEEAKKFRLTGSGLVWRPSYLYCMGLYKGFAESDVWQRDLVKSIAESYTDHANVNTIKARLTTRLTECKFQAQNTENGINILLNIIADITAINKSILDSEKETSMNGYATLQFINETIVSWTDVNF